MIFKKFWYFGFVGEDGFFFFDVICWFDVCGNLVMFYGVVVVVGGFESDEGDEDDDIVVVREVVSFICLFM